MYGKPSSEFKITAGEYGAQLRKSLILFTLEPPRAGALRSWCDTQRRNEPDQGASLGPFNNFERAADVFHSFAHITQTASSFLFMTSLQAAPVIFDFHNEAIRLQTQ